MSTAYTADQYVDNYPRGIERQFWHVARNATILRWLRKAAMDRLRLLEIGCGTGIVVDYLRAAGVECLGCDIASPDVPQRLAGIVFPGTDFRTLPLTLRSSVEGALLFDVIEHVADPVAFLRGLRNSLPALKRVMITVPARDELWSPWDDHFGHFRRYDRVGLCRELTAANFRSIGSRYFFQTLYLPIWLAKKKRGTAIQAPTPALALLHRIIGRAMTLEQAVIPGALPGSSIIAVAEPN